MNALDNANIQDTQSEGFASFAFPLAKTSRSGESVEYIRDASKSWYVLRILFGQVEKIADTLISDGHYSYVAMIWKVERKDGKKHKRLVPFLNILFSYLTEQEAETYVKDSYASKYITFYYNHFDTNNKGKNPPLVIKEKDIERIILATSTRNEHVMQVDLTKCNFVSDDMVYVTDGPFKGITGRVARIARQKRVVISIEGLSTGITTAYIPPYYLKKIE